MIWYFQKLLSDTLTILTDLNGIFYNMSTYKIVGVIAYFLKTNQFSKYCGQKIVFRDLQGLQWSMVDIYETQINYISIITIWLIFIPIVTIKNIIFSFTLYFIYIPFLSCTHWYWVMKIKWSRRGYFLGPMELDLHKVGV